jgi:hypothetical protein
MQAITTRYAGPTVRQGSRIIATAGKGQHYPRLIVAYDQALDPGDNHRAAAHALADRFGWLADGYTLASGSIDADTYAHVLVLA